MLLDEVITFADNMADTARTIARSYFRYGVDVEQKTDLSPVTIADRDIEKMMRSCIQKTYATHGILGEEYGSVHLEREYIWVLDPIDGTKSFVTGHPLFGTMICLLHKGEALFSLVDIPMLDERWIGVKGKGVSLNGVACRVSACKNLADAAVYTTSMDAFSDCDKVAFDRVTTQSRLRRFGGDCYSYGLLASGHIDVVFGAALEPYDFLPLCGLIESAGGVMTDWSGKRLSAQNSDTRIVASSTKALHDEILELLNS